MDEGVGMNHESGKGNDYVYGFGVMSWSSYCFD